MFDFYGLCSNWTVCFGLGYDDSYLRKEGGRVSASVAGLGVSGGLVIRYRALWVGGLLFISFWHKGCYGIGWTVAVAFYSHHVQAEQVIQK